MRTSITQAGGRVASIVIERDEVEVPPTLLPALDPEWTYKDGAGHEHRGDSLRSTLEEEREDCRCDAIAEPHDVHVGWVCRSCGETITPGTKPPSMFRTFMPGETRMIVDFHSGESWVCAMPGGPPSGVDPADPDEFVKAANLNVLYRYQRGTP